MKIWHLCSSWKVHFLNFWVKHIPDNHLFKKLHCKCFISHLRSVDIRHVALCNSHFMMKISGSFYDVLKSDSGWLVFSRVYLNAETDNKNCVIHANSHTHLKSTHGKSELNRSLNHSGKGNSTQITFY